MSPLISESDEHDDKVCSAGKQVEDSSKQSTDGRGEFRQGNGSCTSLAKRTRLSAPIPHLPSVSSCSVKSFDSTPRCTQSWPGKCVTVPIPTSGQAMVRRFIFSNCCGEYSPKSPKGFRGEALNSSAMGATTSGWFMSMAVL